MKPIEKFILAEDALPKETITVSEYTGFRSGLAAIYKDAGQGKDIIPLSQPAALSRSAAAKKLAGESVPPELAQLYFTDVPEPHDLTELPLTFGQYARSFGPDIARAKMVCDTVAANGKMPLPVGGACLIDTWGLSALQSTMCKENPALKAATAEALIANVPYYTQATGTMLQGGEGGVGLMYLEVFPWFLRAQEYGVSDAKAKTVEAYNRMYATVQRRGWLVNPSFAVLGLQFEDLQLEQNGHLRTWFEESMRQLPGSFQRFVPRQYDPEGYLAAWVRYTYHGPNILPIVKCLARDQYGVSLDEYGTHVRTKQLDHFHAPTFLMKEQLDERDRMKLENYSFISALAIDNWQLTSRSPTNGFVGFDDLSLGGDIVHQTVQLDGGSKKLPSDTQGLATVLESPLRLHAGNLDEHLGFLDFVAASAHPNIIQVKEVLKQEAALVTLGQNLAAKEQEKQRASLVQSVLASAQQEIGDTGGSINIMFSARQVAACQEALPDVSIECAVRSEIVALFTRHLRTKEVQKYLRQTNQKSEDAFFPSWINSVDIGQTGDAVELEITFAPMQESSILLTALTNGVTNDIDGITKSMQNMQTVFAAKREQFDQLTATIADDITGLSEALRAYPEAKILPLVDNMIVAHAVQLSFDPDMRAFVIDAVDIANSPLSAVQKQEKLGEAMSLILPKLKQYLTYIMKGGEYPMERFARQYRPVYRSI